MWSLPSRHHNLFTGNCNARFNIISTGERARKDNTLRDVTAVMTLFSIDKN